MSSYGYQTRRKGSMFERFSGWLFYNLINVHAISSSWKAC